MARTDLEQLVYQMSADITQLSKQTDKALAVVNGNTKAIQNKYDGLAANINKSMGAVNVDAAMGRIFDNSRLKLFDTATARIGLTGGALEKLGIYGVGAALGIAAVDAALKEALGAAKFANDLENTANRLHLTTDALQEYQAANLKAGGTEEGANTSLEAFSATLGKAQEGLVKSQRAFLALGFTKAQIAGFKDANDALEQVVKRIGELKSPAQQDAVIDQLGLQGLKPLIDQGADGMARLRAEAEEAGQVMDAGLVAKGAAVNKEIEELTHRIDIDLKSAFISLAPVMLKLLDYAAQFADAIARGADAIATVQNKSTAGLIRDEQSAMARIAQGGGWGKESMPNLVSRVQQDQVELANRAQSTRPVLSTGTRSLISQAPVKKGPADQSAEELDKVQQEQIAAGKALVDNMLEWVKTYDPQNIVAIDALIDQQAQFEYDAVEAARQKEVDAIAQKLKRKEITAAVAQEATATVNATAATKDELVERKRLQETAKALADAGAKRLAEEELIQGYYDGIASNNSAMASSSAERRAIELKILAADQKLLQDKLDQKMADDPLAATTHASQYAQEQAALNDKIASDTAKAMYDTRAPMQVYLDGLKNIDDELQTSAVTAMKGFSDALANVIFDSKNFASSLENVFKQLFAQILSAEIQKNLFSPLLGALGLGGGGGGSGGGLPNSFFSDLSAISIPGFASGTDFAPGGLAVVGENGPELVNLGRGSQVMSNDVMNSLGGLSSGTSGGPININVVVEAKDAVLTSAVQGWVQQGVTHAMRYTNQVARATHRTVPAEAARRSANTLR